MASPITETLLIVAVVAVALTTVGLSYLIYLARLGKPLNVRFSGYGINLVVGQTTLVQPGPDAHPDSDNRDAA